MEFFLNDPKIKRFPPSEIHILHLNVEPYPDSSRLRVRLELTPFLQKPYLDITVKDANENIIATTSVVEPTAWKLDLTLHIKKTDLNAQYGSEASRNSSYSLIVSLSYPNLGEIEHRKKSFQLQDPSTQ